MKKSLFMVLIFCNFTIASIGIAQTVKIEATELFKQYRRQESNFSFAVSMAMKDSKLDGCALPFFGDCKPLDEMFRIKKEINVLADQGDVDAMFYTGLLKVEMAEQFSRNQKNVEAQSEYDLATAYYKRAGDGGAIGGYWNVANMYAKGTGVLQSNSAAIEWFYKAGVGYSVAGLREKALAALDAIEAIDKEHLQGKRLKTALAKNAPK